MFRYKCLIALFVVASFSTTPVMAVDRLKEPESPKKRHEIHLDQIVVTDPAQKKISGSAKPVTILHDEELQLKRGSTIGETLKLERGVHGQSFGPGVGLPVIRGQSGPRVRVLSNGLGANDAAQASPDHASTVVPLLAEQVEVLRGPATLLYGSGAIGGVVNVIDNRIPERPSDKLVGGALEQRFNSVADEYSSTLKIEGGKDYFAYHFDGFYRDRGDTDIGGQAIDVARAQVSEPGLAVTQNTTGFIRNSAADARGGSAGFSLVGDAGFIGVSGNLLKDTYGIPPEGTDDSELARITLEQNKFDFKSQWNNPLSFLDSIRARLSFTDYEHQEGEEGLFRNDTFEGRIEIPHKPFFGIDGVIGFQSVNSKFAAMEIESNEFIVIPTRTNSYGVFATESATVGPVEVQAGVRVESTSLDPAGFDHPFRSFTPISASASGIWSINDYNRVNVAYTRSQRAPQVQELFFEGFHEPIRAFEQGNPNLGLETSHNVDVGYRFFSDWAVVELDVFHNWVDDYIFLGRTGAVDMDGNPIVLVQQTEARFVGYEANLIFPLMDNQNGIIDLTLFSDYTRGRLINRGDVPQMPPLRWGFQVDYVLGEWSSNLRLTRGEAQDHPGVNEANTPDYVRLDLATHYHVEDFHGAEVMLYAKGNNLLDENIRNSTSFLRNLAPESGIGAEIGVRVNF